MTSITQSRNRLLTPMAPAVRAYRNVGYWLLLLPLAMLAGFWIPYLSRLPQFPAGFTAIVHFHALLLFAWITVLVLQPFLIRYRALDWHRTLGQLTYVLVPLVVLSALAVIGKNYSDEIASGATPMAALRSEYLAFGGVVLIVLFYGLAIGRILRRDVAGHLRYMACSAVVLLPAGLSRMLGYGFGVPQATGQAVSFAAIDILLLGLLLCDRPHHLPTRPFALALAAYAVFEGGWGALGWPV